MSVLRTSLWAIALLAIAAVLGIAGSGLAQGGSPSASPSFDPMAPSFFTGTAPVARLIALRRSDGLEG